MPPRLVTALIPTLLEDIRARKVLLQYLFRDGRLPKGWGLYIRGRGAQGFTARSDVGFEAKVDIRDGVLLMGEVTLAHLTFTFAFGNTEVHTADLSGVVLKKPVVAARARVAELLMLIQFATQVATEESAGVLLPSRRARSGALRACRICCAEWLRPRRLASQRGLPVRELSARAGPLSTWSILPKVIHRLALSN